MQSIVVRPSAYIAPYVGQSTDPRQVGERAGGRALVLAGGFIRRRRNACASRPSCSTARAARSLWSDKIDVPARRPDRRPGRRSPSGCSPGSRCGSPTEEQLADRSGRSPTAPRPTSSTCARATLLFRYLLRTHDEADLEEAVKMLHEAIGQDPDFAQRARDARAAATSCTRRATAAPSTTCWPSARCGGRSSSTPRSSSARLQMVYVDLHHGDKEQARATRSSELRRSVPTTRRCCSWRACSTGSTASTTRRSPTTIGCCALNPRDVVIVELQQGAHLHPPGPLRGGGGRSSSTGARPSPSTRCSRRSWRSPSSTRADRRLAQALLEEVLRQNPHFDGVQPLVGLVPVRSRASTSEARALDHRRGCARSPPPTTTSRSGWPRFYAMEGLADDAIDWVRRADPARQRELPAVRRRAASSTRCARIRASASCSRSCAGAARARESSRACGRRRRR